MHKFNLDYQLLPDQNPGPIEDREKAHAIAIMVHDAINMLEDQEEGMNTQSATSFVGSVARWSDLIYGISLPDRIVDQKPELRSVYSSLRGLRRNTVTGFDLAQHEQYILDGVRRVRAVQVWTESPNFFTDILGKQNKEYTEVVVEDAYYDDSTSHKIIEMPSLGLLLTDFPGSDQEYDNFVTNMANMLNDPEMSMAEFRASTREFYVGYAVKEFMNSQLEQRHGFLKKVYDYARTQNMAEAG